MGMPQGTTLVSKATGLCSIKVKGEPVAKGFLERQQQEAQFEFRVPTQPTGLPSIKVFLDTGDRTLPDGQIVQYLQPQRQITGSERRIGLGIYFTFKSLNQSY